jgi:hypothetical protein
VGGDRAGFVNEFQDWLAKPCGKPNG